MSYVGLGLGLCYRPTEEALDGTALLFLNYVTTNVVYELYYH